ncbi:two-component sensor histidine kinase [Paenibacillus agaridevorans]|uniref:Two-component sensor histidine kinase n=1 Tax=Paenibacillus agaridevorans TaxID=171404 RepID=A0A2R5EHE4_9BACL|nr:sensor histidine kinase [Paenibacillus agaridevorans]GBG05992.1 two-component sensor histidine kinase [Paenibacillus agaridevorans]
MRGWLGKLVPHRLKYRLFAVFVLVILLPFSVLNIYNYQRIETLVQNKISEQSHEQLDNLHRSLEDQLSIAFKTLIFLEQDADVREVLQYPDKRNVLENQRLIERKFKNLNNSFFLYNPSVYFTLLDDEEGYYASVPPRYTLDYDAIASNPYIREMRETGASYFWVSDDENYVSPDISKSPTLLSLYATLKDNRGQVYGWARISIDFSFWFQSVLQKSATEQVYFILSNKGEIISRSAPDARLTGDAIAKVTEAPANGYWTDRSESALVNYSYLSSLDWYLVNQIPLSVLFQEIESLKQQYFVTFFVITVSFIILAFMIAYAFTRPLSHIQAKMKEAVRKDLRIRLPEKNYKGEVLELTRTFNGMMVDMNALIHRLKAEERQRDAVHFQMLLAQVNPHFLLNTLNTMKWIGLRSRNEEIVEICLSLGKLLEISLNSDVDLIHLRTEIELTKAFIYIQQVRYSNKFVVEFSYEEDLQYALVPKLSLQPLVDNAIKHGIASLDDGGCIYIRMGLAESNPSQLVLEVEDNGVGMEQSQLMREAGRSRPGIGLHNVRERLRLLFKEGASLEAVQLKRGMLFRMNLPFLLAEPYELQTERSIDDEGGGG